MVKGGRIRDIAVQDLVKHNTDFPLEDDVMLKLSRFIISDKNVLMFPSRFL